MKWLLTDDEFYYAMKDNDWMFEFMMENGITSMDTAKTQFIYGSTEYDSPDCPFCGAQDNKHYTLSNGSWKCKKCGKMFSLTTNRYVDNTKLPITHWWRFSWLIANSKMINSCAIARDLEVTQKTAWLMINTLKEAMFDSGIKMKNASLGFKDYWDVIKLLMTVKHN